MNVSFGERLALLLKLAGADRSSLPDDACQLARCVGLHLGQPIQEKIAQTWIDGHATPSWSERISIASCYGFVGDDAVYLVSDEPAEYMPYYETVSTYVELAGNGSGFVALRPLSDHPLSGEALEELGRLA